MLVTRMRARIRRSGGDRGYALLIVLGVMLLLSSIGGIVLSSSTFAATYTTSTVAQVQARAAADAGVDVLVAQLAAGEFPACGTEISRTTDPKYRTRVVNYRDSSGTLIDCNTTLSGVVPSSIVIASDGFAPGTPLGSSTGGHYKVMAEIAASVDSPGGAALYSYGGGSFGAIQIQPGAGIESADVRIYQGDMSCYTNGEVVDGDLRVNGNVYLTNSCRVNGNVHITGNLTMDSGTRITGTATAGGNFTATNTTVRVDGDLFVNGNATMHGRVGGDLEVGGSITLQSAQITGSVRAGGVLNFNAVTIGGSVRTSSTATTSFSYAGGGSITGGVVSAGDLVYSPSASGCSGHSGNALVACKLKANGIVPSSAAVLYRQAGITAPAPKPNPVIPGWAEVGYPGTNWDGYAARAWTPKNWGNAVCDAANWNNGAPGPGDVDWKAFLEGLTVPTVIDLRSVCSAGFTISFNGNIRLKTEIALIANKIRIANANIDTLASAPATKLWLVVPDNNATDKKPSCTGVSGDIDVVAATIGNKIAAILYTPCKVSMQNNAKVRGQFYSSGIASGGGGVLTYAPVGIPGVDLDGAGAGSLAGIQVSSRLDLSD